SSFLCRRPSKGHVCAARVGQRIRRSQELYYTKYERSRFDRRLCIRIAHRIYELSATDYVASPFAARRGCAGNKPFPGGSAAVILRKLRGSSSSGSSIRRIPNKE